MLEPVHDLVVDDVEAHGGQGHAGHDVDGAEPDCCVGVVVGEGVVARHHVAEADGGEAHEAEIEAVEQRPVFQLVEDEGAETDVDEHHDETEEDGGQDAPAVHGGFALVVGAQTVDFFDGAVLARRVEAVAEVGVGTHVKRLLQTHLLLQLKLLTLPFHLPLLLGHAFLVVATVAAVGAKAAAQRS